jgi:mannose-6-phosphate isomerase-like protein (cupin superfamily)
MSGLKRIHDGLTLLRIRNMTLAIIKVDQRPLAIPNTPTFEDIRLLEEQMMCLPGARPGCEWPVRNFYAHKMCARELFMPKGSVLVGKMHRYEHFYVLMSGEITAWTTEGMVDMKGPKFLITPSGTKRVIAAHTNAIMITFHGTEGKIEEDVEEDIIVQHSKEENFIAQLRLLSDDILMLKKCD